MKSVRDSNQLASSPNASPEGGSNDAGLELLRLIRFGMLFEVQEWIADGKPLSPCGKRGSAIVEAAESCFHSMVRVLLDAANWDDQELARAIAGAALRGNSEVVSLLLVAPSVASLLCCSDLSRCMSYEVWSKAVRLGMPLRGPDGFGSVLSSTLARPLLRLFKDLDAEFPDMQKEGSLALCEVVKRESARGVALLIWAGVDPLMAYEDPDDRESTDSAWYFAPAVVEAARRDRLDLVKMMKVRPTTEQWWSLVRDCAVFGAADVVRFLINLKGSAKALIIENEQIHAQLLESSIHGLWRTRLYYSADLALKRVERVKGLLHLMLEFGVRLRVVDAERIRIIRQIMYGARDEHAAQTLAVLATVGDPGHIDALRLLCDTPKFRSVLRQWEPELFQELFPSTKTAKQ